MAHGHSRNYTTLTDATMLYFSGFPTIMLIIVLYVAHLGVTVLTNV